MPQARRCVLFAAAAVLGVGVGLGTMSEITYIGERTPWGKPRLFGVERVDRRHHLYVVGKTGLGKTTLLRNLLLQDIHRGEGVGLTECVNEFETRPVCI